MAKYDQGGGCACGLQKICDCGIGQADGTMSKYLIREIPDKQNKEKLMSNATEFKDILKEIDNEYAGVAEDGIAAGDVDSYISTGSYSLNALLSGSIYGGLPSNKVTALAGEPSTGKTFYLINMLKQFLIDHPTGLVIFFESEGAISRQLLVDRGVDVKRVLIIPVSTVQEFRTQATKILDRYLSKKESERVPMFFALDSLGNLSTSKEMEDIAEGKDTRDMTRSQLVRGAFRVLTLKLGKAKVPLVVTNHVYDVIGSYVPMKKMGGGSGLEYAASTIIFLSKKKDKDKTTNAVTGAIITATLKKARMTVENKKVETLLNYQEGLDPYYGLLDLAEKFNVFKKISTKYELPDGGSVFEKQILAKPETIFTESVLDMIEEKCPGEFLYGGGDVEEEETNE